MRNRRKEKRNRKKWVKIGIGVIGGIGLVILTFWIVMMVIDTQMENQSQVLKYFPEGFTSGAETPTPDLISYEAFMADFNLLRLILLEVHPILESPNKIQEFEHFSQSFLEESVEKLFNDMSSVVSRPDAFFTLSQYAAWLGDAHTHLRYQSVSSRQPLPRAGVSFRWVHDGIVVEAVSDDSASLGIEPGDQLVRVGSVEWEEIQDHFQRSVSSENEHWLRFRIADFLPYQYALEFLGVVSKGAGSSLEPPSVEFTFSKGQSEYSVLLELKSNVTLPDPRARNWFGFEVLPEGIGYFWLDQCSNTQEYRQEVIRFFETVERQSLHSIAIDLRENTGGDSSVVDIFLSFLAEETIQDYRATIRASAVALKMRSFSAYNRFMRFLRATSSPQNTRTVSRVEGTQVFKGSVWLLTSKKTFSSGNYFAVMLHDHGLAKTIGETTGNSPSAYGDLLRIMLPQAGFQLGVSYKHFQRPDPTRDPQTGLVPDVSVFTTVEDVQYHRDPVLAYLQNREKQNED